VALALVGTRTERVASPCDRAESEARLARAISGPAPRRMRIARRWVEDAGILQLEIEFSPAPQTQHFLRAASLAMTALIASSLWAIASREDSTAVAFLLPLFTVLTILGLPFGVAAMGSQREAEEARYLRAIRNAFKEPVESAAGRSP
jgi:hypothetical protein